MSPRIDGSGDLLTSPKATGTESLVSLRWGTETALLLANDVSLTCGRGASCPNNKTTAHPGRAGTSTSPNGRRIVDGHTSLAPQQMGAGFRLEPGP